MFQENMKQKNRHSQEQRYKMALAQKYSQYNKKHI